MPARASASRATTTGTVRCRPPTPSDGRTLWHLARSVGLDLNSPYAYVPWADHFAASSVVAGFHAPLAAASRRPEHIASRRVEPPHDAADQPEEATV